MDAGRQAGEKTFGLLQNSAGRRPVELLEMKNSDMHLSEKYMRGGVKTAAGKNRVIPIVEKIFPFIAEIFKPQNDFLIMQDGKPITYQNFLQKYWRKNEILNFLPTKHLPHDAEDPLKIRQLMTR